MDRTVKTGWICPKCGRVLAPTVLECSYCNTEDMSDKLTTIVDEMVPRPADPNQTERGCDCDCGSCKEEEFPEKFKPNIILKKVDKDGNVVEESHLTEDMKNKEYIDILCKVLEDTLFGGKVY